MSSYLTEADLGERLGADEATVGEWRRRYSWPHIKIGRQVRFSEADVRAIESMHHVEPTKPTALPGQTSRSASRAS